MKMDQGSGNVVTQFFAWFAAIAAACGFTTQDMVYMLFGLIGVLISLASFISGRLDARKTRKENEKRTKIVSDYLDDARAKPAHEKPAAAPVMMEQFQKEKEGTSLTAYADQGGVWTICGGVTRVYGQPVVKGLKLTRIQCDTIDKAEQAKALAWVDKNVHVPLTVPQKVGIASFCPWNIGPGKCFPSTFFRKLNSGDRLAACAEIKRWIWDGGKDCRIRSNNCFGQVERRDQESELTCWGLDE